MYDNQETKQNTLTSPNFMLDVNSLIRLSAELICQLVTIFDLDEMLETAVLGLQQKLGYDQVTLQLLDSGRKNFALKIQSVRGQQQAIQSCLPDNFASLAHRAIRHRSEICVGDSAAAGPTPVPHYSDYFRSELHIPLQYKRDVLGALSFASRKPHIFDVPEVSLVMRTFATQLAAAIEKAYQCEQPVMSAGPQKRNELTTFW